MWEELSHEEMLSLFSKIDANSDGLVAWDEFLSFMVLSSQLSLGLREDAQRPRQNLLDTAPTAPPLAAYLESAASRGEAPVEAIATALSSAGPRLALSGLTLSAGTSAALALGLKAAAYSEVELSDLKVGGGGVKDLAAAVASHASLASLSLAGSALGDAGIGSLAPLLRGHGSALTALDLKASDLGNNGAAALAELLATNLGLRTLDLQRNAIKDQGAIALAAALQVNGGLQALNLRFNEVSDAGATSLGKALQGNGSVTELHLGGNLIGAEGAVQLAAALVSNTTLRSLNLRSNAVLDAGAVALAQMTKRNGALLELFLGANGIGEEGVVALADAWKMNATLQARAIRAQIRRNSGAIRRNSAQCGAILLSPLSSLACRPSTSRGRRRGAPAPPPSPRRSR